MISSSPLKEAYERLNSCSPTTPTTIKKQDELQINDENNNKSPSTTTTPSTASTQLQIAPRTQRLNLQNHHDQIKPPNSNRTTTANSH
jgi:hypothetical protein